MKTIVECITEAREDNSAREELREILRRKAGDQRASDRMKEISKFTLKSVLGKGQEGVCVKTSDGRVLKVYYGEMPVCISMLAAACRFMTPKCLPKIEKGDHWILRDEYKTKTSKCREYASQARKYMKGGKIIDKTHKQWLETANYELSEIGACPLYQADIKLDNFGEDKKGNIVLIDF